MLNADGEEVLDHRDWIRIIREVEAEVKEDLNGQGRSHEFVGLKVCAYIIIKNEFMF
jgi:hypothetical protein